MCRNLRQMRLTVTRSAGRGHGFQPPGRLCARLHSLVRFRLWRVEDAQRDDVTCRTIVAVITVCAGVPFIVMAAVSPGWRQERRERQDPCAYGYGSPKHGMLTLARRPAGTEAPGAAIRRRAGSARHSRFGNE